MLLCKCIIVVPISTLCNTDVRRVCWVHEEPTLAHEAPCSCPVIAEITVGHAVQACRTHEVLVLARWARVLALRVDAHGEGAALVAVDRERVGAHVAPGGAEGAPAVVPEATLVVARLARVVVGTDAASAGGMARGACTLLRQRVLVGLALVDALPVVDEGVRLADCAAHAVYAMLALWQAGQALEWSNRCGVVSDEASG